MSNQGKFYDRSPIICPAGRVFAQPDQSVAKCMKFYSLNDQVDAMKHEAGIFDEREKIPWRQQRMNNTRNPGIYTEIWPAMQAPVKTRYESLINELKETTYDSLWNKEVGRVRDPTGMLPAGMKPMEIAFGVPTVKECSVGELVNPPKTAYQVLWDSQVGHDLYKKSHNDYNPGERIDRGYSPPYDSNKRWGKRTYYDPHGIWVKCACRWHINANVLAVSKIQADMEERTKYMIGKERTPNKNIERVPLGHRFGKKTDRPLYGVEDLLKDPECPPCLFKRDFINWIHTLSQLRNYVYRKRSTIIDLNKIQSRLLYYDKEHTGWLPKDLFYSVCSCYMFIFKGSELEPLFKLIGILRDDDHIHYKAFFSLIDKNIPLPQLVDIQDIPEQNQYYITTNQAANCDRLFIDNSKMPMAGIPIERYDLPHPALLPGECKADLESLGQETTADACMNPSIYTNYGLNHRDFFKPREPEIIRQIFENIGYKFTDEIFQKYWQVGVENDKTGLVCVDTFKRLLKKNVPPLDYMSNAKKMDLSNCEGDPVKLHNQQNDDCCKCECKCDENQQA